MHDWVVVLPQQKLVRFDYVELNFSMGALIIHNRKDGNPIMAYAAGEWLRAVWVDDEGAWEKYAK